MSRKTVVQSAKADVSASVVDQAVVELDKPIAAATEPSEVKEQSATEAAAQKLAAKKTVTKKATVKVAPVKPVKAEKAPAKPVKKAAAEAKPKAVEVPKEPKIAKVAKVKIQVPKKPKLVRDSFTMPESDYALFETLKQRVLAAGIEVKKSELLRASLVMLAKLDDAELIKAIGLVERIKTGRPKK